MDVILLLAAGFGAGVLNAIAGGGTFLTFPALVFIGLPAIPANATSAVAVFPGYLSSALAFKKEIAEAPRRFLVSLVLLSILGGVLGALLLLVTPGNVFSAIVPWLLLVATLLFAFDGWVRRLADRFAYSDPEPSQEAVPEGLRFGIGRGAISLIVTSYGGYFNGGLGIVLLALLSGLGMRDIHSMNGLKNGLSFILSLASVITFTLAGLVFWYEALVMMGAAILGGWAGAHIARMLPVRVIRAVVILVGFGMSLAFFLR